MQGSILSMLLMYKRRKVVHCNWSVGVDGISLLEVLSRQAVRPLESIRMAYTTNLQLPFQLHTITAMTYPAWQQRCEKLYPKLLNSSSYTPKQFKATTSADTGSTRYPLCNPYNHATHISITHPITLIEGKLFRCIFS